MAAEIYISKIKVRRGQDTERKSTVYDQGELISTLDTKRLYVGNGVLSGGNPVSAKIHPPINNYNSLSNVVAEVGDLVSINSIYFQLTANPYSNIANWGDMRLKVSPEFTYNNNYVLNVSLSGLSANKINPDSVTNGLYIKDGKLQINYNTSFFNLSSNTFSLKAESVTERELLSSTFGNGLSGGNNNKVTLAVSDDFYYTNGVLNVNFNSVSSYGDNNRFFTHLSAFNALSGLTTAKVGDVATVKGFFYQLTANDPTVLNYWMNIGLKTSTVFNYTSANELTLQSLGSAYTTMELPRISVDEYGRTTSYTSSVYGTLTGNSTLNDTNSLSSIFNGTPSHSLSGGIPGLTITKFEAISTNGATTVNIVLSSAGFLTFEGGFQTRTGESVGRFAIPIFTY